MARVGHLHIFEHVRHNLASRGMKTYSTRNQIIRELVGRRFLFLYLGEDITEMITLCRIFVFRFVLRAYHRAYSWSDFVDLPVCRWQTLYHLSFGEGMGIFQVPYCSIRFVRFTEGSYVISPMIRVSDALKWWSDPVLPYFSTRVYRTILYIAHHVAVSWC